MLSHLYPLDSDRHAPRALPTAIFINLVTEHVPEKRIKQNTKSVTVSPLRETMGRACYLSFRGYTRSNPFR
jgi:hypothetical protein